MSDNAAAIAKLQRNFGQLDKEVLAAVLEVCNNDVKEATKYLQAVDGGGYDAQSLKQAEGGIPKDYPGQNKPAAPVRGARVNAAAQPDAASSSSSSSTPAPVAEAAPDNVERVKSLFLSEAISYQEHFDAQTQSYDLYASVLLLLLKHGVEISKASRPRVLAACWARKDRALADHLLSLEDVFGLPPVLSALGLLDAGRKTRAIEKKAARLEAQGTAKARTVAAVRNAANDFREAKIGSLSGSLAKRMRAWVRRIPASQLEFYALNMPKQPWCELADMLHTNPKDFQCPWFLEYVFGKEAPEDSMVVKCRNLNADNVAAVLQNWPVPYSYLRLTVKPIPEEAKPLVARYSPIDTIIWYHEELACPEVDKIIEERLVREAPTFGYGKLMERLMYFRSMDMKPIVKLLMPIAESRLKQIDLKLEGPVVVVGDASYSMDVAIRTATVIGSVLAAVCNAELKFFTGVSVEPPVVPRCVKDVLSVAATVKADGLTAPAAVLWPYYKLKTVVKMFIVVTDEIENEKFNGHWFPSLFKKYYDEVYPAKIAFVSFLQTANEKGRMVTALESMGIVPLQFRLDGRRPDLTKLDHLLGVLGSETSFFPQQVAELSAVIREKSVVEAIARVTPAPYPGAADSAAESAADGKSEVDVKVETDGKSEVDAPIKDGKTEVMDGKQEVVDKLADGLASVALGETKTGETAKAETGKAVEEDWVVVKRAAEDAGEIAEADKPADVPAKLCVICDERPSDTALLECGHFSFCSECAKPLKECPICRAAIVRQVRIFTQ